jgi:hypothetical protein
MSERMFGKLPGKMPVGLRSLDWYVAGALPKPPASVAVPAPPPSSDGTLWGMDGNDTKGDCGVAGVNHGFMADAAVAGLTETSPSDDEIVQYYLTYTGGQDTGVVLSDFLAYVRKQGFFGRTLSAYAPFSVHDIPTLHTAVWMYDFAYTGIKVTQPMMNANQAGQPWDLDDMFSEVIGGHCVPIVGYDKDFLYCITWGGVQRITYSAWHFMSDEAWALITGEFAAKGGDGRGVNLAALQADLNKLAA